jgi:CRISPR-associated protein Cas5t
MEKLWLRVHAPFATYSTFRSGTYRDTMPTMPPSAAYGLILNLAGIEMRGSLQHSITPIKSNLPPLKLAFGRIADKASEVSVLLQHMHNYPVGASGKEHKTKTHGSKYGIEPTHRETIIDLDMMLGIIADPTLISRVKQGLAGEDDLPRYGLPFAGDNNYLFDSPQERLRQRIDCLDEPIPSHWFVSVDSKLKQEPGAISLTVEIDRHAPSKTKSMLFSATKDSLTSLPDRDWLSMYERRIIRR